MLFPRGADERGSSRLLFAILTSFVREIFPVIEPSP